MLKAGAVAVLCSLLVFGTIGCDEDLLYSMSFTEVATERSKLIDGIESYQSIEEAKRRLPEWKMIENSSLAPGDPRPPFTIYVVSIKNYSHLDYAGELHLKFFNNRLAEARFYPNSFEQYVDRLKEIEKLTFSVTDKSYGTPEAVVPPYTRIWIYNQPHLEQHGGSKYVGWEDIRLDKEETIWIKRYS